MLFAPLVTSGNPCTAARLCLSGEPETFIYPVFMLSAAGVLSLRVLMIAVLRLTLGYR